MSGAERAVLGTWRVAIATPIGTQDVVLEIRREHGALRGTATRGAETVPMIELALEGARLCWAQEVTRPLKLRLAFEVEVAGGEMRGVARAGMLPASKVVGTRVA